uniref:Metalloendopeptidase n=1 Tax=Physocyclus mexicanus TaxID=1705800 RepID=A0A6B9KDW7_9ARAC|nr:astacin metalloprotease M12 peptidase [Physocyclus mexicanus]
MKVVIMVLFAVSVSSAPGIYDRKIIPGEDVTFWKDAITVEGDILVPPASERLAAIGLANPWPKGEVAYQVAPRAVMFLEYINGAIWHIQNNTCIRFKETSTGPRLYFVYTGDCQSFIGKIREPVQPLEIGNACENIGGMVHEILHALGFGHEHKRSDRDNYVKINYENILTDDYPLFEKYNPTFNILLNDFDYDSIMLYGEYTGNNGVTGAKSMESKNPGQRLLEPGEKGKMSKGDIEKVNEYYRCTRM